METLWHPGALDGPSCRGLNRHKTPSQLKGPLSLLGAVQDEFQQVLSIPLPQMAFNAEGHTYVVLARPQGVLAAGKLLNTLKFTVKEIDPSTGAPCAAE